MIRECNPVRQTGTIAWLYPPTGINILPMNLWKKEESARCLIGEPFPGPDAPRPGLWELGQRSVEFLESQDINPGRCYKSTLNFHPLPSSLPADLCNNNVAGARLVVIRALEPIHANDLVLCSVAFQYSKKKRRGISLACLMLYRLRRNTKVRCRCTSYIKTSLRREPACQK